MDKSGAKSNNRRYFFLYGLVLALFLLVLLRLFVLQIRDGKQYQAMSEESISVMPPIKAPRGEITDRNGQILVANRKGHCLVLSKNNTTRHTQHQSIINLFTLLQEEPICSGYKDQLPISLNMPFSFTDETAAKKIKEENNIDAQADAEAVLEALCDRYQIASEFSKTERRLLAGVSYDMKQRGFLAESTYVLFEDVTPQVVMKVQEHTAFIPAISVEERWVREYCYPKVATHILGSVGQMNKAEYEAMKEQGYRADDVIGKQGAEKAFEQYLRGTDGTHGVTSCIGKREIPFVAPAAAIGGNTVMLTLDIDLQCVTEAALKEGVLQARGQKSANQGGAAVAVEVHTGEILAAASYPTYDLAQFHAQYGALLSDKAMPMFNRVISGVYEPGSTYKPITAIAAMDSGVLMPKETIQTKGKYPYLDRTFQCNLYRTKKQTHGTIDVARALGVSCNYFFYEAGRRTGIRPIAETAEKFGLGKPTGIELSGEAKGNVATPENREKNGGVWYPGDVLQAAIGQSDNLFSPLQLANYAATLANGGKNYQTTILKAVKSQTDDIFIKEAVPKIRQTVEASKSALAAVKSGMLQVTQKHGTAGSVFADFPISVAGKTGSAQVRGGTNGLFIGYAPAENPKIAVAVVLEKGDSGTKAAMVARKMLEQYFQKPAKDDAYQEEAPYTLLP